MKVSLAVASLLSGVTLLWGLACGSGKPFETNDDGSQAGKAGHVNAGGEPSSRGGSSTGGVSAAGGDDDGEGGGGTRNSGTPPTTAGGDSPTAGAPSEPMPEAGSGPGSEACGEGSADCNEDASDGCETQLGTSENCNRCNDTCSSATAPHCGEVAGEHACVNPAQALNGQRIALTCVEAGKTPELCSSIKDSATACPKTGSLAKQTVLIGGAPGTLYQITLRIRGIVEPHNYVGGRAAGDHFYVGGAPQLPSNFNVYSLAVSAPAQTFFVNADTVAENRRVFKLDHEKSIVVEGGATLTLQVQDPDCTLVRNCQSSATADKCEPFVVPDIPPAPKGFDGQFVQFDVVSVKPAN